MIEAMKQALGALEELHRTGDTQVFDMCYAPKVIPALRQAIEQAENQEPVAWGVFDGPNLHDVNFTEEDAQEMVRLKGDGSVVKPLYTSPQPQMQPCAGRNCGSTDPNLHSAECFEDYEKATGMRAWQGLTDEEMLECNMDGDFMINRETAKRNVEAKLKEKNHG